MRYILALILLSSCTKETFIDDTDKVKTRYVRSVDGEHEFNVKNDTLIVGDTIMYEYDGVAYQLFSGENISVVTKVIYQ